MSIYNPRDRVFCNLFLNMDSRVRAQKAFRSAIEPSIKAWKRRNKPPNDALCPILNIPLNRTQTEVDHHPVPFIQLVHGFFEQTGLSYNDISCSWNTVTQRWELYNSHTREKWLKYHDSNATLRVVSKKGNRKEDRERTARIRQYEKNLREMRKLDKQWLEERKIRATLRERYDGGFL